MKLYYDKRSLDPTYFIQIGIRNGKKTTTKNVARIGKHSELLKITSNPLAFAKQKVKEYNDNASQHKLDINFSIDFDTKLNATHDIASHSSSLNIGYFILQHIYHDLKIHSFFDNATKTMKNTFDCNDINRFLTFARVLEPQSKLGTFDNLSHYYENPNFAYQHIFRFMDILADNYDNYLEHLFINSDNIIKRDTSVCYFDCTNYYFEIEQEDSDYVDEVTGEVLKGFRKYGISKQHQPSPLVQMGLFMDGSGIPISMCLNSGSDNEQKCAVPLEKKIIKTFKNKQFIYCADAGLGSINIRKFNSIGGRGFIVTQSIKKLSRVLQQAVFNDCDYKLLSSNQPISIQGMKSFDKSDADNLSLYNDHAYKILEVESLIDIGLYEDKTFENGNVKKVKSKGLFKQKIIITFSRKMMEYQRHIRNAQIERAKQLVKMQDIEALKKGPHDVKRFIKRTSKTKDGIDKVIDTYEIDEKVIKKEEMYDGYYAIATNLNDDAKTIFEINSKRYKIEDCFRVLKTNFHARPVYHRNKERITAHFMICYTALLIYRLLEKQLDDYDRHYTTQDIITTLRNMNVVNNGDAYYQAIYNGSDICSAMNGIYDLGLDKKYHLPKELNKKIKKISK